jgi:hypothetical protein
MSMPLLAGVGAADLEADTLSEEVDALSEVADAPSVVVDPPAGEAVVHLPAAALSDHRAGAEVVAHLVQV